MKKYLFAFIIFILLDAALIALLNQNVSGEIQTMRWALLGYFSLITVLFHYGITRATQSRPQVFVRYYMASTTIRLLLNLAIIVVYAMFHKEIAVNFILTFMIYYFLFTIFEVVFVWKTVKTGSR